jgi:hypothetical protein
MILFRLLVGWFLFFVLMKSCHTAEIPMFQAMDIIRSTTPPLVRMHSKEAPFRIPTYTDILSAQRGAMEWRIVWMKEKRVPTTSSSNRRSSQNHVTEQKIPATAQTCLWGLFYEDADEEIGE